MADKLAQAVTLQQVAVALAHAVQQQPVREPLGDVRVEGACITFTFLGERFCAVVEYDEEA